MSNRRAGLAMNVLITGAAGFIGSAVARRLLADGHRVRGVDLPSSGGAAEDARQRRIVALLAQPGFELHERDLRGDAILDLLDDTDVVVNEAAVTGLDEAEGSERRYREGNVEATHLLLDQLDRFPGLHLVHASTSSVYGRVAAGDEEQPRQPISAYGRTKLAAEDLISNRRATAGLSATVLRYFSVYGPDQRPDMAYAIFCDRLLRGLPIDVTGTGRQTRSNTYIDDVVSATVLACQRRPNGQALNICGGESISTLAAIDLLATNLGVPAEIRFVPSRVGDQRETRGNASLARAVLGWSPKTTLADGLARQAASARIVIEGQRV
jgi:nucleoside-diphosphate-sugar epimerase